MLHWLKGLPFIQLRIVTGCIALIATGSAGANEDLPRFMSLKIDGVELRHEPRSEAPAQWKFQMAGLPVEVLGNENGWARIRDSEGITGWIRVDLLSRRRTVAVLRGGDAAKEVALRSDDNDNAGIVALLEPGLVLNLFGCSAGWCLTGLRETRGYISQRQLWGVAPDEPSPRGSR